jgi:hypothetical protein
VLSAIDAVPLRDELLFGLRIVHQHQIGVAMRCHRQCLAGTLDEDVDQDAGRFGELGQDVREETRIFDRGRRREHDRLAGAARPAGEYRGTDQDRRRQLLFHHHCSALRLARRLPCMRFRGDDFW